MSRDHCLRCFRPTTACFCAHLPSLLTRAQVVVLQHPRERKVAIGTARMTHLALPGSTLAEGLFFDDDPRLAAAFASDDAMVLWPGDDAVPVERRRGKPPAHLVVVDGTWHTAKKMLALNPRLAALPRLAVVPTRPGNYRIRKEPRAECLATIEAVASALGVLEDDDAGFAAMLAPFEKMVDEQLRCADLRIRGDTGPRRKRLRVRPLGGLTELAPLVDEPRRAVVIYGEANAQPKGAARTAGAPELVHLVAAFPATGQRFEAILRPRRPLVASTAHHLEIDEASLRDGEDAREVVVRFQEFLARCGAGRAVVVAWGPFTRDLLADEGMPRLGFVDLRALAARALRRSSGGAEQAAASLDVDVTAPWARGRAGRMITALAGVLAALVVRARAAADQSTTSGTSDGGAPAGASTTTGEGTTATPSAFGSTAT